MDVVTDPDAPARGAVEQGADAAKKPAELFRWAEYVHVGDGADGCPGGTNGKCEDREHFHAFCRLPNQFQHSDIRNRALAAKARRMRLLKDPESDASVIFEADLDELARTADREALIDELVNVDWWKDHLAAMREAEEDERFEHIQADRDRLKQLDAQDPMERDNDERSELLRHMSEFNAVVEAKRKEAQAPRRSALEGLTMDELVAQTRDERLQAEATTAFMESYSKWEWFACTYKPTADGRPNVRIFDSIEHLENSEREILEVLATTFSSLEAAFQRGPTGNS